MIAVRVTAPRQRLTWRMANLANMDPVTRSAYEAALAAIERRKLARGVALRPPEFGEALGSPAQTAIKQAAADGWKDELTQLAAHASADVLLTLHAAEAADQEAHGRYQIWDALASPG